MDSIEQRLNLAWLEPALTLPFIALTVVGQWGVATAAHVWFATAAAWVFAAMAGRFPIISTVGLLTSIGVAATAPVESATIASLTIVVAIVSALGRQTRYARLRVTVLALAGCFGWIMATGPSFHAGAMMLYIASVAVAIGAGLLWHLARQLLELQRREARDHLAAVQLELSRELHDTVAHTLGHIALGANRAMTVPDTPQDVLDALDRIADDAETSGTDLRELLSTLREGRESVAPEPGALANATTLEAEVHAQADRLRELGFQPEVRVFLTPLSAARSLTLAKVTREVVNNIVKHAPSGTPCQLELVSDGDWVTGTFVNATSRKSPNRPGIGLTGMRERLHLLKGTLETHHGDGFWSTIARLPT